MQPKDAVNIFTVGWAVYRFISESSMRVCVSESCFAQFIVGSVHAMCIHVIVLWVILFYETCVSKEFLDWLLKSV